MEMNTIIRINLMMLLRPMRAFLIKVFIVQIYTTISEILIIGWKILQMRDGLMRWALVLILEIKISFTT